MPIKEDIFYSLYSTYLINVSKTMDFDALEKISEGLALCTISNLALSK